MQFTVKMNYSMFVDIFTQKKMENAFLEGYNEIVNVLNDNYEKWNEEYSKARPDVKVMGDEYNEFIRRKQLRVIYKIQKKHPEWHLTFSADEENNIIATFPYLGKTCTMWFTLVQ